MTAAASTAGGWLVWELEAVPVCPVSRERRARALARGDAGKREPVQLELFDRAPADGASVGDREVTCP